MKRAVLAATSKARWICEQAHQQLKEKLGLDHFEGRSWQGLHRHALMTMIAYAFLQHRHLTQVGRKKESTDRRLSLACRPYATPSSISFFDHYLSNAHTAEDEAVKNSGVVKSAKVVLERDDFSSNRHPALFFCLSMIFSENRFPLFRIMLLIASLARFDRIGRGRPVGDLLAEQAADQFDRGARGAAALVEEGIEFDNVGRPNQSGIVQHLHHQMRLAIGCAAGHSGANAGRQAGVE